MGEDDYFSLLKLNPAVAQLLLYKIGRSLSYTPKLYCFGEYAKLSDDRLYQALLPFKNDSVTLASVFLKQAIYAYKETADEEPSFCAHGLYKRMIVAEDPNKLKDFIGKVYSSDVYDYNGDPLFISAIGGKAYKYEVVYNRDGGKNGASCQLMDNKAIPSCVQGELFCKVSVRHLPKFLGYLSSVNISTFTAEFYEKDLEIQKIESAINKFAEAKKGHDVLEQYSNLIELIGNSSSVAKDIVGSLKIHYPALCTARRSNNQDQIKKSKEPIETISSSILSNLKSSQISSNRIKLTIETNDVKDFINKAGGIEAYLKFIDRKDDKLISDGGHRLITDGYLYYEEDPALAAFLSNNKINERLMVEQSLFTKEDAEKLEDESHGSEELVELPKPQHIGSEILDKLGSNAKITFFSELARSSRVDEAKYNYDTNNGCGGKDLDPSLHGLCNEIDAFDYARDAFNATDLLFRAAALFPVDNYSNIKLYNSVSLLNEQLKYDVINEPEFMSSALCSGTYLGVTNGPLYQINADSGFIQFSLNKIGDGCKYSVDEKDGRYLREHNARAKLHISLPEKEKDKRNSQYAKAFDLIKALLIDQEVSTFKVARSGTKMSVASNGRASQAGKDVTVYIYENDPVFSQDETLRQQRVDYWQALIQQIVSVLNENQIELGSKIDGDSYNIDNLTGERVIKGTTRIAYRYENGYSTLDEKNTIGLFSKIDVNDPQYIDEDGETENNDPSSQSGNSFNI